MVRLGALDQRRAHEVLAILKHRADELGLDLLVIGATARDIKVALERGLGVRRATKDVDVAVHVDSFADYQRFMSAFTRTSDIQCVLVQGVSVDVLPFGDIERDRTVQLEEGVFLDVLGLREASRTADLTEIAPEMMLRVASLEAQIVLKTTAWRGRAYGARNIDAVDLACLLEAGARGTPPKQYGRMRTPWNGLTMTLFRLPRSVWASAALDSSRPELMLSERLRSLRVQSGEVRYLEGSAP